MLSGLHALSFQQYQPMIENVTTELVQVLPDHI